MMDAAEDTYLKLTAMYSHRGDGIPTQFVYPEEVRDAAKVLWQAAQGLTPPKPENAFQRKVADWMLSCFTEEIAKDGIERADRFCEEALELVQAAYALKGADFASRAHTLVDYVAGRPVGHLPQEVGGAMVTLAALCGPFGIDMMGAAWDEAARVSHPEVIEKIRTKQASKADIHGALP